MSGVNVPRIQGDDYQARWFWMQACRLFYDRTKAVRVAYEQNNVKSFDDVVIYYNNSMQDDDGTRLEAEYYQVKFHVTAAGAITWQGMMDPAFINASTFSILQRLKDAQQQYAPNGSGCHFKLYTPWMVHPDDPLAEIFSRADGKLIFSKLEVGGNRSNMGRIRKAWRDHLQIDSDDKLKIILKPLRIVYGPTLKELGETLNDKLKIAGMIPVEDGVLVHPYDELIRKLLQAGRKEFTRSEIQSICEQENLWRGQSEYEPDAVRIGIRSFLKWAENLEDETDEMLCLLKYFDGRKIRSNDSWQSSVIQEIATFLSQALQNPKRYHLFLHTHTSIAFAVGYITAKAGVDIIPVQAGKHVWRPDLSKSQNMYERWIFNEELITSDGKDVVLALNITHNVLADVKHYTSKFLKNVRRIISCEMPSGPSRWAVVDGTHALYLANNLSDHLKTNRTEQEREGKLHIFIAAPNGLSFYLGQLGRSFGNCVLYEYDFDRGTLGAYQPSISFPLPGVS